MAGQQRGFNSGQGRGGRRSRGSARRTQNTPHLSSETDVQTSTRSITPRLRRSSRRTARESGKPGCSSSVLLFLYCLGPGCCPGCDWLPMMPHHSRGRSLAPAVGAPFDLPLQRCAAWCAMVSIELPISKMELSPFFLGLSHSTYYQSSSIAN